MSEPLTEAIATRPRDHLARMRHARAAIDESMARYETALEALTRGSRPSRSLSLGHARRAVADRTGLGARIGVVA